MNNKKKTKKQKNSRRTGTTVSVELLQKVALLGTNEYSEMY